jgi:hypothetical protein
MGKSNTFKDNISPIGTFQGHWVTQITERDGTVTSGRGDTPQQSSEKAAENRRERFSDDD